MLRIGDARTRKAHSQKFADCGYELRIEDAGVRKAHSQKVADCGYQLAVRERLTLATLDTAMRKAAEQSGVTIFRQE